MNWFFFSETLGRFERICGNRCGGAFVRGHGEVVMAVSYREHAIPAVVVAMRQDVQLSYNESSTLAEI